MTKCPEPKTGIHKTFNRHNESAVPVFAEFQFWQINECNILLYWAQLLAFPLGELTPQVPERALIQTPS